MPATVRRLEARDIPAVEAIEREAFDEHWPPTTFARELENGVARYVVLELDGALVGFAGLWLQFDQAHVVTVAVRPGERRAGLGTALVLGLLAIARAEDMDDATLEVRDSNAAARALYAGLGFWEVGRRKRYYEDNGEDAVIMTTEALASERQRARFEAALQRVAGRLGDEVASCIRSLS